MKHCILLALMIFSFSFARAENIQINLNTADASALQQALDGIGPAKARAIVSWRESHGPFARVEDLVDVPGIGQGLLQRNMARLQLGDAEKSENNPVMPATAAQSGLDKVEHQAAQAAAPAVAEQAEQAAAEAEE